MDDMVEWYRTVIRKYAQFTGRSRRKEYWMFTLANLVIYVVGGILSGILGRLGVIISGLIALYALAVIIPSLAVAIRRLHDTGRSGWWMLISFVPLIGGIILLVFFAQDGEPGDNQYGPNPKSIFA